jgi:hypothetical protein
MRSEVLHRVSEERNIVNTVNRRKASCIGHILRRNCILKHVTEGMASYGKTGKKIQAATG